MSDKISPTDKATVRSRPDKDLVPGNNEFEDNKTLKMEHAKREAASQTLEKSGTLPKLTLEHPQMDLSAQQKGGKPRNVETVERDGHTYLQGAVKYERHLGTSRQKKNNSGSIRDHEKGTTSSQSNERELINGIATGIYKSLADPVQQLVRSPNAINESIVKTYETDKGLAKHLVSKVGHGDYKGLITDVSNGVKEVEAEVAAYPKKPPFEQGKAIGEAATFFLPIPPIGKLAKMERFEEEAAQANRLLAAAEKSQPMIEQLQAQTTKRAEMLKSKEYLTSETFRVELKEAIDRLSPKERDFLAKNNVSILGVRRLQDVMEPRDRAIGVYKHNKDARQIFIPEEFKIKDGWQKNTDIQYALSHEVGHAVDLNQVKPLSDEPNFSQAIERDLRFTSPDQREYLLNVFKDEDRARKEVFAASYARAKGIPSNTEFQQIVQELFSHSFKYVEGTIDDAIKK